MIIKLQINMIYLTTLNFGLSTHWTFVVGYLKSNPFESVLKSFDHKPNVLNICESHLRFRQKVEIDDYKCYTRNRKVKSQGGIATCIRNSESNFCLKVGEGTGSNEYLNTRHSH